MSIHPTAVIDPRAELAAGVSVGPYSVVGPDVRIGGDTEIGAHSVLEGRVTIGARCRIGHGALIGGVPQDLKYRATVVGLAGVRPFARIGTYAYVGGCSKVVQDVPPFVMVDGAPATARAVNVIAMRRGGIDVAGRRQVKAAFRILYRSGQAPG